LRSFIKPKSGIAEFAGLHGRGRRVGTAGLDNAELDIDGQSSRGGHGQRRKQKRAYFIYFV